jgi:acetyl/propionyl-CoA carboxylase alpha subunit
MNYTFDIDGNKKTINIEKQAKNENEYEVDLNGKIKKFTVKQIWNRNYIIIDDNNKTYDVFVDKAGEGRCIFFKGRGYRIKAIDKKRKNGGFEIEGIAIVKSPLPGVIKRIEKKEGDKVTNGEGILFLEAMKMENEIKSPKSGILKKIYVKETDALNAGDKIFIVE